MSDKTILALLGGMAIVAVSAIVATAAVDRSRHETIRSLCDSVVKASKS